LGTDWDYVNYVIVDCAFSYLSLLHLFFEYSGLIAFFSETALCMVETSVYTKENLATEMLVVTEIYAKFTSMPYACKEHIQVYVVAK
jgi:hypothetical protein